MEAWESKTGGKATEILSIAAKLVGLCVRILMWLTAALVALAAAEAFAGSLVEAARLPYAQALILVVGTPLLVFGLYLERGGRSGRLRR